MQINISFALLGLLGLGAVVFGIYVFFLHEKLREKKRLLMVLPDPVILIDVQRRVIYLNRAAEQFMGLSHPRAIGRSLTQIGLGEKDQEVLFSRERVAPLQIQWGGGGEKRWFGVEIVPLDGIGKERGSGMVVFHDISSYKRLEYALEASQALYRNVTEQAEDGIAIVKGDLIVYTNPRLLAMTGYLPGDILYREFSYFIPPEHVQPLVDGFSRRVGGDSQPFLFETQLSRKDGVSLPVEVKLGLMSFEGEEAALVLIQDITLRKEAESQMRLQSAALRSAANGFVITDWEGRIQWVNAALEAMTGYSFEEVVGKNPRIFKSGKQDRAFYEQLWSTILAGRVWQGELVNRKKGGDFYDEHLTIAPVMDNNGQITHFVAVKEDISERKQNEKALRRSERQFRELVWNTPISMMIFGYDHRLLYVNLRFSELFGYQAQDIPTFDHWWELAFVSEGHREQIRQEWRAHFHSDVQDSSGFIPIEAEVICKNGRHRFVRFSLVLLEDKYIVALTDLTKQKRAEQHLQQRARNLSLLNEITLSALRTNDLDGLCQELADQLMAFFEAEACFITLWDEINRLPVPMAASGPLRDTYRTMAHPASGEPTLTETVLQARRVIFVEDVLHSPHTNPLIAAEFQSRSILALPLIADNRRLGAAIISYNQHHFFTEEDVERGERAAAQVALGLAKVRLFEAEREKHQLSLALVEISTLLSASLSVSTLLTRILDLLQRVVPYDAGNIFGIENGISRVLYTRGYEQFGEELDKYVQTVELEIAKTPNLRRMVETQLPLIISNTADAPDWVPLKTHALFRSWAGAPIHYNGKVMAIISLEKQEPDFFQPEHAGRLAAFAGQAAIALENARLFEEVRQLATVDALTGAYTRRHILDLALQEIQRSRRYGNPFCVIMFDIDHFKKINDTYGHLFGDGVLQKVIQWGKEILRRTDKIGRFGGEEFLILLPETEIIHAVQIAERIRKKLEQTPFSTKTGLVQITVSMGVSNFRGNSDDRMDEALKDLIDHADQALYAAKEAGRNCTVQYIPPTNQAEEVVP